MNGEKLRTQRDSVAPEAASQQEMPPPDPDLDPDSDHRYPTWGALRWLFLFRLLMVIGLILAFSPTVMDPAVARSDIQFAWRILAIYGVLVLAGGLGFSIRWPRRESQVQIAIFVDILTFALLMHAAGGVSSGLGILLAVSVAAGALMMEGRMSLLFAAFASIAVMSQQLYSVLIGRDQVTSFPQAGLLGLLFFAVALLSHVLYLRVRDAEALAARRQVDIDDLSKLNDFIIQSIATGILVADGERRLRLVNQAALDLLGMRRLKVGAALSDISPELSAWLIMQIQPDLPKVGLIHIGDRAIRCSLKLLGDYRASGVIIYLRDNQGAIKEAQQMKLASLGTLTASIAHNIRNPLSAVAHAGQLLAEDASLSDDNRHLLEIVRRNSARIEETVQSVLQLSRRDQVNPSLIDLADWLKTFAAEFRECHELSDSVFRIDIRADASPLAVEADPRHLHQILANLCENALIHGRGDDQPLEIQARIGYSEVVGDIWLEIVDNGPGIAEDTAQNIFTPFFTTTSKGTGLGLYIARELAETNGIRLKYEPAEPQGCCFRLSFSG
jgi:two-component system, NtrC family, sensor histidine kinase PilS